MFRFRAYDSNDSSDSEPAQSPPCSPPSSPRLSTPLLTLETDAMDAKRLQNIEEGLREQVAVNRSMQEMLACLFDKFNNLELPNHTTPQQLITPPTLIAHSAPPHKSCVKPGVPQNFDGDREGGWSFLTFCQLYISLSIDDFADEQAQIHWALSYFKSGRAATFADRTLRAETKRGGPIYATWADFEAEGRPTFCLENEATTSLMRLESERYFQGRRTVDQYVDEFSDLIDLSGYSDPLAIVINFPRAINASTQDRIAESGTDRPVDNDPDGWYRAARRFNLNRLANEAFHAASTKRSAPAPHAPDGRTAYAFPRTSAPTQYAKPAHTSAPPPFRPTAPLHPGIPTDIDAQHAKASTPHTCHHCGSPNHLIRDCPRCFDVRHMCTEEIDDFFATVKEHRFFVATVKHNEASEAGATDGP